MKESAPQRVPVRRRAVEQRITRALRKENKFAALRKSKSAAVRSLGEYFVIDESTNGILASRFDLEEYARKLKAIAGWEYLEIEKGE